MIVKNNWMTSDTLRSTRENMIKHGLKNVINYPIPGEVFKNGASVSVNIFHIERDNTDDFSYTKIENGKITSEYTDNISKYSIIPSNKIEKDIISKLAADLRNGTFESRVYPTEPFRITSTFTVGRGHTSYLLDISDKQDAVNNVKIAYMDGRDIGYKYININNIPNRREIIDEYKVISGGRLNKNKVVISNVRAIDKMSACTSSWAILFSDKDIEKTKNAYQYINTKFFKFLVSLLCDSNMTNISPYRFSLVPLQDFNKPWTDEELYKKYKLTQEEIDYIESAID